MAESHHNKSNTRRKARSYPSFIRLFFKQAVASLVFGILFFLMSTLPAPSLNNCARALGDALRFEMKIPTENFADWLKERIALPQ